MTRTKFKKYLELFSRIKIQLHEPLYALLNKGSVSNIWRSPNNTIVRFDFINYGLRQYLAFAVDGDCCSFSWINNLTGVANLLGEEIIEILEKPEESLTANAPSKSPGEEDDVIQYYGYTFKTAKGSFDLEFRNSSNGYYGGSLSRIDRNLTTEEISSMIEVTEDF